MEFDFLEYVLEKIWLQVEESLTEPGTLKFSNLPIKYLSLAWKSSVATMHLPVGKVTDILRLYSPV